MRSPRFPTRAVKRKAPSHRSRLSIGNGARAVILRSCSPKPRARLDLVLASCPAICPMRRKALLVFGFRVHPCVGRDICPRAGWIAFDPTNRSFGSLNLIPLAVARNIEQVNPVAGNFVGTNVDLLSMQVTVRVEVLRLKTTRSWHQEAGRISRLSDGASVGQAYGCWLKLMNNSALTSGKLGFRSFPLQHSDLTEDASSLRFRKAAVRNTSHEWQVWVRAVKTGCGAGSALHLPITARSIRFAQRPSVMSD